jgi:hypothetical protein
MNAVVITPITLERQPFIYSPMMARLFATSKISTSSGTATTPLMMAV